METMVLLVFLGIVWAAVAIYWLRTRMPALNLSVGTYARRLTTLDAGQTPRPATATIAPLRSVGTSDHPGVTELRPRTPAGPPGHSLTAPAVAAPHPQGPRPRSVSSEEARLRRRNVLVGLAGLSAITLIGVFVVGGAGMIMAHLIADALLLGFVMILVQYQRAIELDRTQNLPVLAAPRDRQLLATGTDGRWR